MGRKNAPYLVRVTGILEEEGKLLIIRQKMSDGRKWYLPGGQLEPGETIEQGIVREMEEETGLHVELQELLAISDTAFRDPCALHILLRVKKLSGTIHVPHCTYDTVEISDVQFVPFEELVEYGFGEGFVSLVKDGFPLFSRYVGMDTFFDFAGQGFRC